MVAVERPRRAHGGCWGSCGDGDRSRTDPAGPGALSPLPRGLLPVRSVGSGSALTQKVVGAEGNLEARQPPPSPPPPPGPGVCCAPGVALPVLGTAPGRAVLRVPSASPSGAARGAMCGGVELRSCATLCSPWRRSQEGWHSSAPALGRIPAVSHGRPSRRARRCHSGAFTWNLPPPFAPGGSLPEPRLREAH